MNREEQHEIQLSGEDIATRRIGMTAYLRELAAHRAEDGGASHPEEEWVAIKKQVGQLLWRLEAATKPPGADTIHSEHAVRPGQQCRSRWTDRKRRSERVGGVGSGGTPGGKANRHC